ncbi:MAG: Uma2 family endonuclease [Lachnospiraceae bacterium]|nr:Uma2 family endonuclease [Lachnospiraceae bacterium]
MTTILHEKTEEERQIRTEPFEQGKEEKQLLYDETENDPGKDMIGERAFSYAWKHQGDYTLEDYYALPDDQRSELIDGVIYNMSAPTITHQIAVSQIVRQLADYVDTQKGSCLVLPSPMDVQLDCDERTMLQPDVVVVCDWNKVTDRCVYGAPDLVMEILSPSTERKDQIVKTEKYRKAGVREYWMIDIERKRVVVHDFSGNHSPVIYDADQGIPVQIFDRNCLIEFGEIFVKVKRLRENRS